MVWPAIIAAGAALAGGALSGDRNRRSVHEQMDFQREFAQMGIRWRVADAKAAGIHPLYALGSSGASAAPISVGDSYGPVLAEAGQDISRAMMAGKGSKDRLGDFMKDAEAAQYQRDSRKLDLEERSTRIAGQVLQNENEMLKQGAMLRALRLSEQMRRQPSFPDGTAPLGAIKDVPSERVSGDALMPGREAASTPGMRTFRYGNERSMDLPGAELSESLEGMGVMGHLVGPYMTMRHWLDQGENYFRRRDREAPPGYRWEHVGNAWRLRPIEGR